MLCGTVFDRFVEKTPATVLFRGILERTLTPEHLNQLFDDTAQQQYTRELLFSSTVDLLATVACRIHPSVHAAYVDDPDAVGVSVRALYDKLAHMETPLGEELVRHTATQLQPVLKKLRATQPAYVSGYTTKILDGNHLAASEHRLLELRDVAAGPLPGQTLVVLEPEYQLVTDVFCNEDGHAQERVLLPRVLDTVQTRDLWLADRNFCTTGFLFGVADRHAGFLVRQHAATLSWDRESVRRRVGRTSEGVVYERTLWLRDDRGRELEVRQITLVLDEPTRDGTTEIRLLTNLPKRVKSKRLAQLYRQRWTIEHYFLNLTTVLHCELNTLGYPKAALFSFCVAVAAGNVLATVKGALARVHGIEKVAREVSDYHLALDVRGKYQGMMVALPAEEWQELMQWSLADFVRWLLRIAARVRLERYPKKPRGAKKDKERRTRFARKKHIATAQLLAEERAPQ